MSELINNSINRKKKLKELILKLHEGHSQEEVRQELLESLSQIPYGEVVEVEQELISEGLPEEEVLKLCDAHSAVLQGNVDLSASKQIPDGHPIDVMLHENKALKQLEQEINKVLATIAEQPQNLSKENVMKLRGLFNQLFDVDKHYQRKEYLLFPFLENHSITGPPKVMWGKHDEIRELIKGSIEILKAEDVTSEELLAAAEIVLLPAIKGVVEMTIKEEEILFPMTLDMLTDAEWYEIEKQSLEIGYCLYDPPKAWKPAWAEQDTLTEMNKTAGNIQLPSGSFKV